MFWSKPICPVEREDKEWLEDYFLWLIEEFGANKLRATPVYLPNAEFFPDPYTGDVESLHRMLRRMCGYMGVDYGQVDLRLMADEVKAPHPLAPVAASDVCGLYRKRRNRHQISVEENLLNYPEQLVATLAHELAHARIIGENRIELDEDEDELLTDLATFFFGFGVFTANSLFIFEQWANVQYSGWNAEWQGYMDEEMAGYSLALFAYARGESKPGWARHLQTNVKHYFKQSLKYLAKTGDTSVKPF